MSLRTILLAAVIGLGGTTVASAQPVRPHDYDRQYDRDHRYDRHGSYNRWLTLSAGIPNNEYRHIINLDPGVGRLEKIRVSVDTGRVFVRQIAVIFADGTNRKFRVDQRLRAGEVAVVDLPGRARAVERVIVYTDPARRWRGTGSYSVVAERPATRPQYGYDYRR